MDLHFCLLKNRIVLVKLHVREYKSGFNWFYIRIEDQNFLNLLYSIYCKSYSDQNKLPVDVMEEEGGGPSNLIDFTYIKYFISFS